MKKLLIILLIVLLIVLNCFAIFKGVSLLGINILSIGQIQEANQNLDTKIGEATTLASTDYPNLLKDMETHLKKLEEEKKNYEDMVTISTGEQVQLANQYQKYEVEYLWTVIGNHATKEGVVIKIDIVAANGENNYNLNFTVNGSYIGITEFISDIENDSALGFKIENFSMKPGASTQELQATFTCKDITIKDITKSTTANKDNATKTLDDLNNNPENSAEDAETNNETTENNTNTTNTNANTTSNTNTNTTSSTTNTAGNTNAANSASNTTTVDLR